MRTAIGEEFPFVPRPEATLHTKHEALWSKVLKTLTDVTLAVEIPVDKRASKRLRALAGRALTAKLRLRYVREANMIHIWVVDRGEK